MLVWININEPIPVVNFPIIPIIKVPDEPKIPITIEEFNQMNSQILSYQNENVSVKIWENGIRLKVSGSISYEKPNGFRMKIHSIMGEETDIGSNDDIFWYWSRRDRNRALYYAIYADYHKTRLKTPFNPAFLKESLGLDTINVLDAKIIENENNIVVTQKRVNAVGQYVMYSIFLNKTNKRMNGIVISDLAGQVLASCEIQYEGTLPKRITYDWREEKRALMLEFGESKVNQPIPKSTWDKPDYQPQIDMGID